jgi:hypothetical protein
MSAGRSILGGALSLGGLILVAFAVLFATQESYEFGRLPFLVLGGVGAAAGLALAATGLLVFRGRLSAGLAIAAGVLVLLAFVLLTWGELVLLALVPVAAVLLIGARRFSASSYNRRTA